MSAAPSKLNLRPQERRLIALVGIVVFVVLNIWLVWPHFGDWGRIQDKKERTQKTLQKYQTEIARSKSYQVKLRELESAGSTVVPDEQELDLVRTVDTLARANRLTVIQSDPRPRQSIGTKTNNFFEEQYVTLHVNSGHEELINFLVSLTSTNSLIRVKDLTLKPDPSQTKLDGTMMLVASYQRKTPARGSTATPSSAASTAAAPATPGRSATNAPGGSKPAIGRPTVRTNRAVALSGATNRVAGPKLRGTNQPPVKKP